MTQATHHEKGESCRIENGDHIVQKPALVRRRQVPADPDRVPGAFAQRCSCPGRGLLESETAYTVRTIDEEVVLAKVDVAAQTRSDLSLMPEGQLKALSGAGAGHHRLPREPGANSPTSAVGAYRPGLFGFARKVAGDLRRLGEDIPEHRIVGGSAVAYRSQDAAGIE